MSMSDDLLESMIVAIHGHVESLDMMLKGDGSDGNPGVLIKLDRLIQTALMEKQKTTRQATQVWSILGALIVAVVSPWVLRLFGVP